MQAGFGRNDGWFNLTNFFAHAKNTRVMLERLAAAKPATLACMHGSAWRGDGAAMLRALADSLEA